MTANPLASERESGILRRMSKRYGYRRISGAELARSVDQLGLTLRRFAKFCGVPDDRALRWVADDEDIPHYVGVLLKLLELPGGIDAAGQYTDSMAIDLRKTQH